jgi:3-methyladenine DNA glycosylase/8-oxoguanine DNA glycosylase
VRFGRTDRVFEALVPAVCEQKVTGAEATRAYRVLVMRHSERAPGPGDLWLPLDPERLARLPYFALHPAGIEQRRADAIRRVAARAAWLEGAARLAPPDALARLQAVRGIGPWSAAETARAAFGDPDAVSVGDFHLPHLVTWALAGEPRGTDARMLELLEPWRGQRARVVRLLELSGIQAPRYGPRLRPRAIAAL